MIKKQTTDKINDDVAIANECARIIDQATNARELTAALKNRSLEVKQMLLKLYEFRRSTFFCELIQASIRESKRRKP